MKLCSLSFKNINDYVLHGFITHIANSLSEEEVLDEGDRGEVQLVECHHHLGCLQRVLSLDHDSVSQGEVSSVTNMINYVRLKLLNDVSLLSEQDHVPHQPKLSLSEVEALNQSE